MAEIARLRPFEVNDKAKFIAHSFTEDGCHTSVGRSFQPELKVCNAESETPLTSPAPNGDLPNQVLELELPIGIESVPNLPETSFRVLLEMINDFDLALGGSGWEVESLQRSNGMLVSKLRSCSANGAADRLNKISDFIKSTPYQVSAKIA